MSTTATRKLVHVPRDWEVNYVDAAGNDASIVLRANEEYHIVENGIPYTITIAGLREEDGKRYIVAKIMLYPGFMNAMEKVKDRRFDISQVTEIYPTVSKYVKTTRSNRDKKVKGDVNLFTFAFDTERYSSQYRISIYAGEFVCLALKDADDPSKKSRSIYGHIIDVDDDQIKFSRYVTKRGVRDVFECTIDLNTLLGIYRYDLEIAAKSDSDNVDAAPVTEE